MAYTIKQDVQAWYNGHKPEYHSECDEWNCNICVGALFVCIVCNSAEGSTTSECPGERMTAEQSEAVYAGKLDYRAGAWREGEASRHAPGTMDEYLAAIKAGKAELQTFPNTAWDIDMVGSCPPGKYYFHAVPCTCKEGDK